MSKVRLITLIKIMFLGLGLALAYALLSSISGPSHVTNPSKAFDDVVIGQTAARRVGHQKVWVTRLSALHRTQAVELQPHLVASEQTCDITADLCVLLAATQRSGIDVIYSRAVPAQLPTELPWYGGFVDPGTGEVFDFLGRAYRVTARDRASLTLYPIGE